MPRKSLAAPTIFIVLLVPAGCHWSKPRPGVMEPRQQLVAAATVGQIAPDIDGVDMNGQPLRLADYRGQVVVMNFWANW
jgi:cytochrome oxidase Cu insertion factor (SCO1/SenC/PrrC family)